MAIADSSRNSTAAPFRASADEFVLNPLTTPAALRELYGVPAGTTARHGATCAVAEFFSQFYANRDLEAFSRLTGERATPIDEHRDVEGDLRNDQQTPGEEAQLDVEYLLALAPNSSARFYSMADRNPCDREPRAARAARRREASARL